MRSGNTVAQLKNSLIVFRSTLTSTCRAQSTAALREAEVPRETSEVFLARDLVIEKRETPLPRVPLETPEIIPFGLIPVHPAAQVLHYGLSCFEGMKAFHGQDGRAYLFRPDVNMARFQRSARRLCLAPFDPETVLPTLLVGSQELQKCLVELIKLDRSWLPCKEGYSLYIRPFMFASSFSLGITAPTRTSISIVCSPVGPYFPTGLQPIKLFLNEERVRAWPGGAGDAKVAPNYGPTILPQQLAAEEHGTPQVLYTFPRSSNPEDSTISEVGAMNIFVFLDKADGSGLELVTPPLDGTILPGVNRDSILQLTKSWQEFEVSERPLAVGELRKAASERRLREMFGAGTACIVQPIEALVRASREELRATQVSDRLSLAHRVHQALSDIQYARVPSPWSVPID